MRAAAPSTEVAQPSTPATSATASLAAGGSETDPVAPPAGALLSLAPASGLSFDVGTDELIMTVRNEGDVAASWATSLSSPAVTVSPSEGTLDPGAAIDLTVTADRSDLGNGVSHIQLDVVSQAALAHGDAAYPVAVAVEKAEVMAAHAAPQVICALQSPGAGPKVTAILATGIHLEKADTIWAEIQTPGPKTSKAMDYDDAHDRWVATYSSTLLGAHIVSARAAGSEAPASRSARCRSTSSGAREP